MTRTRRMILLVAAVGLWSGMLLGRAPLGDPDEGRYAEIAREMLESGRLLVPTLDGVPHVTKAPLPYWLAAGGMLLCGRNEWGARCGSALAFMVTLLCAGRLARRLAADGDADRTEVWTLVALGTGGLGFIGHTVVTADPILAAVMAANALAAATALLDGTVRRRAVRVTWALAGLAFFVKGPPGLLLLAAFLLTWRARRDPRPGERPVDFLGAGAFLLLAFWWYALILATHVATLRGLVVDELYARVFTASLRRSNPLLLPLATLIAGTLPWVGWVVARWRRIPAWWGRGGATRLVLAWTGLSLIAFTASRSRQPLYVLPLATPLAVAAGLALARWTRERRGRARVALAIALIWGSSLQAVRELAGRHDFYRHARGLARAARERGAAAGQPVFYLGGRPEAGLHFYLDGQVLEVATPREEHLDTIDLTLAALAERLRTEGLRRVAIGPEEGFDRLPASIRVSDAVTDPASRLTIAWISPAP